MPSELDNLPGEETPVGFLNTQEYYSWIKDLNDESAATIREFVKANDLQELVWLEEYLNPEGECFNDHINAARKAWPGKKNFFYGAKGRRMVFKHQDRIKAWLDECGYTPEKIKMHTSRWFSMQELKYQKVNGAVDPSKLPPNARVIAETGIISKEGRGDSRHEVYGDGETLIEIRSESPQQLKALELASKHQGMLTEKVEHKVGIEDKLREILERRKTTND